MSLVSLHKKYSFVDYQNQLCSLAAFVTFLIVLLSIILPFFLVYNVNNSKFSSSDDLVIYEQPMVKFQFKFIYLAENSMESGGKVILCSSFDILNRLVETPNCAKIKVIEKDENYDGKPDELEFTIEFETLFSYGTKSLSLALFLDARLDNQHCSLHIPAAVVINKKTFVDNLSNRRIVISGSLQPIQIQSLVCPFFLRNIKSHFFHANLLANQTNLEDFKITRIQKNLERNPMHLHFQEMFTDLQDIDPTKTTIKIKLKIPEIPLRFKKTFWQLINDAWINYVAVFIVIFAVFKLLLNHLFEKRWLMARKKND